MKNRSLFALLTLLALLSGLLGAGSTPVRAAGFVVNDSSDGSSAHDTNPGNGVCMSGYNTCTLRAAIEEANALAGADVITFASPMDIFLDPAVGALVMDTQIRLDASGVWDTANGQPGVSISGVDQSLPCIQIYGINAEVYGLFVYNCYDAVQIFSSNNTVGGPLAGQRNVLSSNASYGVYLGTADAHHNVIQGNWIGLGINGDNAAPNLVGVTIASGAHDNTIGGATAAHGNYISGNTQHGVSIMMSNTDGNRLGGNVIGMPAVGDQHVGNGTSGVFVSDGAQNTQIGGSGLAYNTIAYNATDGVWIAAANNNTVEGNAIFRHVDGVHISNGADNRILANHIAYNSRNGVYVQWATSTGNNILYNSIHDNALRGIELADGGNHEVAAPIIHSASESGASGTACAWCLVQLFSDLAEEGETYHGSVIANGSGNWSWSGVITGPYVTATATGACGRQAGERGPASAKVAAPSDCGDTSEFSTPRPLHAVYLPCISRNR